MRFRPYELQALLAASALKSARLDNTKTLKAYLLKSTKEDSPSKKSKGT